jgi:tetratricopeptide (TPR) repeat protein
MGSGQSAGNPDALDQSRQLFEQTLALQDRVVGLEHPDVLGTVDGLIGVLDYQERPTEGLALVVQWLPVARRTWGDAHLRTLSMMIQQANLLRKVGREDEAIQTYKTAFDISSRAHGEEHPTTLTAEDNLGVSLNNVGRLDEALRHHIHVVDGKRRMFGEGHPRTVWSIINLRNDLRDLGSPSHGGTAHAVELIQEIVKTIPQSGGAWTALGMAQYEAGDWEQSIQSLQKSVELRNVGGSVDWFLLSMAESHRGQTDEARKQYERGMQLMQTNKTEAKDLGAFFRAEAEELLKIAGKEQTPKSPVVEK